MKRRFSVEKFTCIAHAFFISMELSVPQLAQKVYSMLAPFRREGAVNEYVNNVPCPSSLSYLREGPGEDLCSQLDILYSFTYLKA